MSCLPQSVNPFMNTFNISLSRPAPIPSPHSVRFLLNSPYLPRQDHTFPFFMHSSISLHLSIPSLSRNPIQMQVHQPNLLSRASRPDIIFSSRPSSPRAPRLSNARANFLLLHFAEPRTAHTYVILQILSVKAFHNFVKRAEWD